MDLQQRQKSREILGKAFESTTLVGAARARDLATAVEESAYQLHKRTHTVHEYRDHILSLFSNLKSNKNLTRQLIGGELAPSELADMPAEELRTRRQKRNDARVLATLIQQEIVPDREAIKPRPSPADRENAGDVIDLS